PETIERMTGHFQVLLSAIVAQVNTSVMVLPLLTAGERYQLLDEWNDTERVFADGLCIQQLIEAQVARTPNQIAVVFEDEQLTYQELNLKANQLARHLQQLGVTTETLVGVSMERSTEMLIALLAVLKAGGAYVPLDPHYPPDRLDYIFQDAQISILITCSDVITRDLKDLKVIDLKHKQQIISQYSTANLNLTYSLDDLAYVIYTSGSTGKPKGVLVTHRGIGNLAYAQSDTFGIKADSCVLQFASFSFDASISEIFMTLLAGAKLCLATSESLLPGQNLFNLLHQQQITHVTLPPSALAMLPREPLPKLEAIIVAGESCPPELAAQWSQRRNFFNAYGPTEITVCATIGLYQYQSNLPIGRPIANTQIYILDELLQPVPTGVMGEIYIGSIGIARGYLNRPELTKERFIVNPFNNSERLYKTGDLGRYLADGNIEYLGRIDHQVKIRGFRIELGEIESSLISHHSVSNCLVIAREDVPGDKRLVAYIVAENHAPTVKELRQFLELTLPQYMIPSHFVILERFPLTPNGKIDRRALPAPELETSTENFIAPRNELEQKLALIWQEVLNLEAISVQDNFFELGGHSLLAATLSAKLEHTFKNKLPLAMLFQMPTIEQQANFFEQQTNNKSWSPLASIQSKGTKPPLFLFQGVGIYYPLSSHLGEDQPVYGLSIEMIDDSTHWFDRIEELVALYIKEIKTVQPQGPYYFGGISFGGMIALEAAQQLLAEGEQVALLALFDTWKSKAYVSHPLHKKLLIHLRRFAQSGLKYFSQYNRSNKSRKVKAQFQLNLMSNSSGKNNRQLSQVTQTYLKARENYVPKAYSGKITLFKSMETTKMVESGDFDAQLGWGALAAGGLDIIDVPGDHLGILREPCVATLAQELKICLDKCSNLHNNPN
ncbi:MAG: non-ribosomal peptide synthetase, partial [Waterburya sp.]